VTLSRWALAGLCLYVAIDGALVFLRPGFSVAHNAESDYGSAGPWAWLMDVNFVVRCAASLAVVAALGRVAELKPRLRTGLVCLVVWAFGSGLLALFADDPVGTATHGLGTVHLVLAGVAFVAVVVGTRLVTGALQADRAWRRVVPALAALSWGALVPVLLLGHARLRPGSLGGLYEKIFLGMELAWFALAAVWVVRLPTARLAAGAHRRVREPAPAQVRRP
jgi:hypothetical membrane protein